MHGILNLVLNRCRIASDAENMAAVDWSNPDPAEERSEAGVETKHEQRDEANSCTTKSIEHQVDS